MTSYSEQYKLHGKEGQLIIPPSKSMVIGWQSGEAALSASTLAFEGKTYNQKPPPQSTHYGSPNTGWARFDRTNNLNTKSC